MLENLPPEIVEQILGHLPTAECVVNLACTNRKLYAIVSANDYGVFRHFVQRAFPSIKTPPLWRDMARILTSRSRAWDRRAFIARECDPPPDLVTIPQLTHSAAKFGFAPVIDSYEDFPGSSLADRREVLAFGAAGRLRVRTTRGDTIEWRSICFEDDHLPMHDILDVKLLRPSQHENLEGESIILQKANHEISRVDTRLNENTVNEYTKFDTSSAPVDCIAVSSSDDPLLAVCNTTCLRFFAANSRERVTPTRGVASLAIISTLKRRMRCAKFLDNYRVATAVQHLEGSQRAPILIYDVNVASTSDVSLTPSTTVFTGENARPGTYSAHTIATLDDADSLCGRSGQVFLSGWTDGIVRLHDSRIPSEPIAQYIDPVDDGQITSLVPFGHERFFAGSHQNACLKMFDLRMPGARKYSYVNAVPGRKQGSSDKAQSLLTNKCSNTRMERDINIFLALTVNRRANLWQPLPRRRDANLPRYRGAVYSLSSPSPSSPRLYAGIENHVIQLDFVSTDDVQNKANMFTDSGLDLNSMPAERVLDLSCYERPREGYESTDAVLLRKQAAWSETGSDSTIGNSDSTEDGWDTRWHMANSWKKGSDRGRWRRGGLSN